MEPQFIRCMPAAAAVWALLLPVPGAAQHVTEEVIVTATPGNVPTNELAQSVTVVGGPELDRVRVANIGESLEGQLGMSATYFGAGASRPIIRGLAGARVRTMEDGIESMDVSTVSADHAVGIDPLVARQIEIFRGPTTLLYGSGSVGGVVNTVTNRIPDGPPAESIEAALELRGDTAAGDRTVALALDGGQNRFAWHVDLADRATDDYEIPQSAATALGLATAVLANSDLELSSHALGGSWTGGTGFFGIAVSDFATQYGIPGDEPEPVRIDIEQTRLDLKGGLTGRAGAIESASFRLGLNDYSHVELEGTETGTRFGNDAYEGRVELLHRPLGRWSGAFGLQLAGRDFSAIGEEAFVPPVETTSQGAFLLERLEASRWDISLGARYEAQKHVPVSGDAVEDSALSFSAAAIRELGSRYSLAVNLALAERLPAAEELFADGPHLASGVIEVGSRLLGKETARHVDIGIRRSAGELVWSVTAFRTVYDDFIYLRDTGVVDAVEDLPIFAFDQSNARFHGIEAEIFTPLAMLGRGELDLRLFTDFVTAELDDGSKVPRIPPLRYGARLAFHAERFTAGFEATRYAAQRDLAPFETPTDAFTLVSADLDWSVTTRRAAGLSLFLRASNLLDEDARRHASLVKDIAPLPGRNFSAGLRLML